MMRNSDIAYFHILADVSYLQLFFYSLQYNQYEQNYKLFFLQISKYIKNFMKSI